MFLGVCLSCAKKFGPVRGLGIEEERTVGQGTWRLVVPVLVWTGLEVEGGGGGYMVLGHLGPSLVCRTEKTHSPKTYR